MTRDEILATYKVENSVITSLGKFEGEPIYAPYFSEFASDGEELAFISHGGIYASLIEILDADRGEFPELEDAKYVLFEETDDGRAFVTLIDDDAHADFIRGVYERAGEAVEAEDPEED